MDIPGNAQAADHPLKPDDDHGPPLPTFYCTKRILKSTLSTLHLKPAKTLLLPPIPDLLSVSHPFPTLDPVRTAVELSNYSPKLTELDVWNLFADFHIGEFVLPCDKKFYAPLRLQIEVSGANEAERAAKELDGKTVKGRRIKVKMVDKIPYEEREIVVGEIAAEMKVQIINAARIYYPTISGKILEVRELPSSDTYYAFLQARDPVTVDGSPQEHSIIGKRVAEWIMVAVGTAEAKDKHVRLEALKDLRGMVEKQGKGLQLWDSWEGSELLDYD